MARNPYDNGHRGPDTQPRDSRHASSFPGEYAADLDEGRFQAHPMQRAAGGFSQSAPPRGASQYGSQESRYGSHPSDRESGYGAQRYERESSFGSQERYGRETRYGGEQRGGESRYGSQEPDYDWRRTGSQAGYGVQGPRYGARTSGSSGAGMGMPGAQYGAQPRSRNRGPRNWQRSDERIREDVCEHLSSLDDVDVSEVSVSVQQGRVTLTGTVSHRSDKHRIEDVADDCVGVRDVDNQIRVRRDDERSSGGFWSQLFGFESGSKARDVMTREVLTVSPGDSVQRAAQIMKDANVGSVPVCDGQRLQGMVTDRDIAVRVVAAGLPADKTQASQAMTSEVFWCYEDDDVADVLDKMGDRQVRRIPVVDRDHKLTGIISLGDMAVQRTGGQVGEALEEISTPSPTGSTAAGSATSTTSSAASSQRH